MRNQLTVHTGKTEAMILKANGFIGLLRPIMFGNALIEYVTNSTCLGIVIDNRLTWTKHHEKVMKSFSAKVKELKGAVGSADLKISKSALLSLNHHNFSNTKPIYTE